MTLQEATLFFLSPLVFYLSLIYDRLGTGRLFAIASMLGWHVDFSIFVWTFKHAICFFFSLQNHSYLLCNNFVDKQHNLTNKKDLFRLLGHSEFEIELVAQQLHSRFVGSSYLEAASSFLSRTARVKFFLWTQKRGPLAKGNIIAEEKHLFLTNLKIRDFCVKLFLHKRAFWWPNKE